MIGRMIEDDDDKGQPQAQGTLGKVKSSISIRE